MIQFSHVYKTYPGPTHALRDVELHVEKGEFVFLTGPSGAGKTTLFKMLSAYDKVTSGQIKVAGYDLTKIQENEIPIFRRKIGVVFQDFKLLKDRTIAENVALPLMIKGDRPQSIERRVNEVLDQVGLRDRAHTLPEFCSGGEQQRAAIARAISHQPGILIADEPTGNLDPRLAEEIMDLLERLCAQGTTVFVATHDHELVKRRKKRVLSLFKGQIKEGFL
ncbi:MAG: cell division ATP-binding protein FtsE [Pseudobdellovibrionaceae bacterium]